MHARQHQLWLRGASCTMRRVAHALPLSLLVASLGGCATSLSDVAARTLDCPAPRVAVISAGEGRAVGTGCGRRAEFSRTCGGMHAGGSPECRWAADTPVTSE